MSLKHGYYIKSRLEKRPKSFIEIRKQIIWGNSYIRLNNKTLLFKSWIKSGIRHINDIVKNDGLIDQTIYLEKLLYKGYWVAELSKLKAAIPKEWLDKIRKRESIMTKLKTQLSLLNTNIDVNMVTNKDIYRTLIRNQVTKPYLLQFWENKLVKQENNWKCIYKQINCFYANRLKQFIFKLISNIINTNEN